MNEPLKLSVWIICCVSIGLSMALADGVRVSAVIQAATLIALITTLIFAGVMAWKRWRP